MSHSLHDAFDAYLRTIGASSQPATVTTYRNRVGSFVRFVESSYPAVRMWRHVLRTHVEGWLLYLARDEHRCSPTTRRNYIFGVKLFLRWLAARSEDYPPDASLLTSRDLPAKEKLLPRALSPHSDRLLIDRLRRDSSVQARALLLMRWTGVRIGELVRLDRDCLSQITVDQWTVRVPVGKLHNDRVVPADRRIANLIGAIQRHVNATMPRHKPRGKREAPLLMLTPAGCPLRPTQLRETLKRIGTAAGIEERIRPHRLRHTYATDFLLRRGAALPIVMKTLGHTTLEMTLRYTTVTQEDVAAAYFLARSKQEAKYRIPRPTPSPLVHIPNTKSVVATAIDDLIGRVRSLAADQQSSSKRLCLQRAAETFRRLRTVVEGT